MRWIIVAGIAGVIVGASAGAALALDSRPSASSDLETACVLAHDLQDDEAIMAHWCSIVFNERLPLHERERAVCHLGQIERLRADFLGTLVAVSEQCAARHPERA